MALTADVKEELLGVEAGKNTVRAAELATILRLAGGLHLISGRIAVEAELGRMIEQGRNRVPITDAQGNVSLGFADKELHEADGQIALSKEIAACTMPVTEAAE